MKSEKRKILLIVRSYGINGPQPIRFKKFVDYWKSEYEIHILRFNNNTIIEQNDIIIHDLNYGFLYRKLFLRGEKVDSKTFETAKVINKKIGIKYLFKKFLKTFFFPDILILEYKKLKRESLKIIEKEQIDIVIASAFPFTTLKLSKPIKKTFPTINFIMDIGDPFSGSATISMFSIKKIVARLFELHYYKYVDTLVVVSEKMKSLYNELFMSHSCNTEICVIQQGFDTLNYFKNVSNNRFRKIIRMIYAGRFYKDLRNPSELILAINKNNNIRLDIYGSDNPNNYSFCCENIQYKGNLPYDKIMTSYSDYDLVIFLDNKKGYQIPGKLYEIISTKKPILYIYNDESPCKEIMNNYKGAVKVENKKEKINEKLNSIWNEIQNLSFEFDLAQYSWEKLSEKYKFIFQKK